MDKQLFKNHTEAEKKQMLQDNCFDTEVGTYVRPLTEEDIAVRKDTLAENYNKIGTLTAELDMIKSEYKGKIDPLKHEMAIVADEIKSRNTEENGTLYMFKDEDGGMMGYYDEKGELVNSRRLRPDEKQTKGLFELHPKTGTVN